MTHNFAGQRLNDECFLNQNNSATQTFNSDRSRNAIKLMLIVQAKFERPIQVGNATSFNIRHLFGSIFGAVFRVHSTPPTTTTRYAAADIFHTNKNPQIWNTHWCRHPFGVNIYSTR
ncbi:hypothetical protein RDWZM_002083 [Blomia tropicalis]|uniref:Uncharacterized protein n=1 Tax=Blomia tropicalis TaxID=40697 RepID=A0A9Q0RPK7_BLOTA|nr:hypothetical protein RDWZM_002083 [Blomia tropicalis]